MRNLLKELGVRTFINARVTITAISGSIMHDYVLNVIRNSSKEFCLIDELLEALRNGNPSIEASGGRGSITIAPWQMISGQEKIVASRIREELRRNSVTT